MVIDHSEEDNNAYVKVSGEIDLYNIDKIKVIFNHYVEARKNITLNMDDVEYIDSAGIGIIISTANQIKELGLNFTIKCTDNYRIKRIFIITDIINYIQIIE